MYGTSTIKNIVAEETFKLGIAICHNFDCPTHLIENIIMEAFLMNVVTFQGDNATRDINTYIPKQYNEVINQIMEETIKELKQKTQERLHTLPYISELN